MKVKKNFLTTEFSEFERRNKTKEKKKKKKKGKKNKRHRRSPNFQPIEGGSPVSPDDFVKDHSPISSNENSRGSWNNGRRPRSPPEPPLPVAGPRTPPMPMRGARPLHHSKLIPVQ